VNILNYRDDKGFIVAPLHPVDTRIGAPLAGETDTAVASLAEGGNLAASTMASGYLRVFTCGTMTPPASSITAGLKE
jgi:hypothetical protein